MLRVSQETRERVQRVAREDFNGVSADEAVRRLLDEHWERMAITAVQQHRENDPHGWADDLAEADELSSADAPLGDGWEPRG